MEDWDKQFHIRGAAIHKIISDYMEAHPIKDSIDSMIMFAHLEAIGTQHRLKCETKLKALEAADQKVWKKTLKSISDYSHQHWQQLINKGEKNHARADTHPNVPISTDKEL